MRPKLCPSLLLITTLACHGGELDPVGTGATNGNTSTGSASTGNPSTGNPSTGNTSTGNTSTGSTGTSTGPALTVDVLVIGSGPAGLSAAWEAQATGASVLLVERDEEAGGSGNHAHHLLAAGTRWQFDVDIMDSPEQLLLEWPTFTGGGDPEDPWVQRLASESAATLDWLVDEHGAQVTDLLVDTAAGTTMRLHDVRNADNEDRGPAAGLVAELSELTWTSVEATELRFDPKQDDRVAGAWVEDLLTGERMEIAATTTVVATGGFARDLDRVLDARPGLEGASLVFEARSSSDGGGIPLLEQAGAAFQNMDHHGVYLHSTPDPRAGLEGEAIVLDRLEASVIVDINGQRVANEAATNGFTLSDLLASAPDKRLWVVYPADVFDSSVPFAMAAALVDAGAESIVAADLEGIGAAVRATSASKLADSLGVDSAGLVTSLDHYADLVASGKDTDFGKKSDALLPLDGDLVGLELAGGSAKSFGGAWLDDQARVLDSNGQPIAGLYAAGEAAGMLGTTAIGAGYSGSVLACYLTGRVAGQSAAAESLSR